MSGSWTLDEQLPELPAEVWTTDWIAVVLAAVGLALLMLVLQWVYRSMEAPRLFLTPDPETGEPGVRWQAVVRYLVLLPFVTTAWLFVFLAILATASTSRSSQSLAVAAAAVIVGARLLAHTNPTASHELGKTIPMVVLSIILIGGSGSFMRFDQVVTDIFANVGTLDTYQNAIIACDILITSVWFLQTRGRWRGEQPGSAERRLRRYLKPLTDGFRSFWNFGKTTT